MAPPPPATPPMMPALAPLDNPPPEVSRWALPVVAGPAEVDVEDTTTDDAEPLIVVTYLAQASQLSS